MEWMSEYGRRWTEPVPEEWKQKHPEHAQGYVFVHAENLRFPYIERECDLERLKKIDEQGVASIERGRREREVEEATERAEHELKTGLNGFTKGMPGVKAARIAEALDKQCRYSGEFLKRRDFIEREVRRGRVVERAREGRRLVEPQTGACYFEKDITKTAMDYAEYLVGIGFGREAPRTNKGRYDG